jgi:hypothetical protein
LSTSAPARAAGRVATLQPDPARRPATVTYLAGVGERQSAADRNVDYLLTQAGRDLRYDTTVYVSTHLRVLVEIWRGTRAIGDELRAGKWQRSVS